MKILFITSGASRLLYPIIDSDYDIVGIIESMPRGYRDGDKKNVLYRILRYLFRKLIKKSYDLKEICKKENIPYNYICAGRDDEVAAWSRELQPDLIVIYSMSQLIKENLISIPKYGVINLHPSFLPDYRGANPDFWQYHDMEMKPGVTVHYVDAGEDTGDIIYQERILLPLGIKSPERLDLLIGGKGVKLILKAIENIKGGVAPRIKQPKLSPTQRARTILPGEHASIINWNDWPIDKIWHILRGTELWLNALPQPRGIYRGQRWIVRDYQKDKNLHPPGSLVKHKRRMAVAVPEGYIYVTRRFSFRSFILQIISR